LKAYVFASFACSILAAILIGAFGLYNLWNLTNCFNGISPVPPLGQSQAWCDKFEVGFYYIYAGLFAIVAGIIISVLLLVGYNGLRFKPQQKKESESRVEEPRLETP